MIKTHSYLSIIDIEYISQLGVPGMFADHVLLDVGHLGFDPGTQSSSLFWVTCFESGAPGDALLTGAGVNTCKINVIYHISIIEAILTYTYKLPF